MTGSSNNSALIAHAPSVQWTALLESADRQRLLMRDQPEAWWSSQAERLASKWITGGLPTTRLEDWKYTSLAGLHSKARTVSLGPVDVSGPDGIKVLRLSQVSTDRSVSAELHANLRSLLEISESSYFEDFAKSFVVDPFVIIVPPRLVSETPIEIEWRALADGNWTTGVAAIIIGQDADVTLLEKYGAGADVQTLSIAIEVGARSRLSHLRLQTGDGKSEQGFVFGSTRTMVLANARYESAQISFGSMLSREDLTVELCEAGAEAVTDGVFVGRSRQLLDHHTNLVHRVGQTTSAQVYKGVLADESRGVFNGRIAIRKNASGSNSAQMNKNLLLSKKVELDTKPQLEIDNDDVKAAHGAAIGRLDAEHIFYLRSRGIGMAEAVEILARGFAMEAVERLSSPTLKSLGASEIERGLAGLEWEAE